MCKIMSDDSDSTSEHEEWFQGGRRSVYKERLLAVEDFLFFPLYSFSCIAINSTTLENDIDSCLCFCLSIRTSSVVLHHPYHLRPTPPVITDISQLELRLLVRILIVFSNK